MNYESPTSLTVQTLKLNDIYFTIGSPWIPTQIIEMFISELFGYGVGYRIWGVVHDSITGSWEIKGKRRQKGSIASINIYGTQDMPMLEILDRTLNFKPVIVYSSIQDPTRASGNRKVINQEATTEAVEKQRLLIEKFREWVFQTDFVISQMEQAYFDCFPSVAPAKYDTSALRLTGLSPEICLRPYQKNAIARIIASKSTLLAHEVGAGKTYVMIVAGMELRLRNPLSKCLYVVPNNITGQWDYFFRILYPEASVLCVSPSAFKPAKREEVLQEIKQGDYDAAIIAHSCFSLIPVSAKVEYEKTMGRLKEVDQACRDRERATHQLVKYHKKLIKEAEALYSKIKEETDYSEGKIFFEDLGISALFIDEAHNYKNVPIATQMGRVLGVSATGSKKAQDMLNKVHLVQERENGVVVMATGTPVTNSISEVYNLQRYLQEEELKQRGIRSFDGWVGMFAEKVTDFEVDVDTSSFRFATRLVRFNNLKVLSGLLGLVADFHMNDSNDALPVFSGYSDSVVNRSKPLEQYLSGIATRVDLIRRGAVSSRLDNMLKVTTDGRKAALDIRLVDGKANPTLDSKIDYCVDNIMKIYTEHAESRAAQLVFCDLSVPSQGFNVYDELKKELVAKGIPAKEIAFIHDAVSEAQRDDLFFSVRQGEVRVLVGSTPKLGIGVNVQERLAAIHHLDIPWRPSDMAQREGRILREGNLCKEVHIYRYIAEGSFDAYSWQLLETKQRFIGDLLQGVIDVNSSKDIDDAVLSYAEAKALAVGNPLIKERIEMANKLKRLTILQRKSVESRDLLGLRLGEIKARIDDMYDKAARCRQDEMYLENELPASEEERAKASETLSSTLKQAFGLAVERRLFAYRGFEVIVPAYTPPDKPQVLLRRRGTYRVELGESTKGNVQRMENALSRLGERREDYLKAAKDLEVQQLLAEAELVSHRDYLDEIGRCKAELDALDRLLVNE